MFARILSCCCGPFTILDGGKRKVANGSARPVHNRTMDRPGRGIHSGVKALVIDGEMDVEDLQQRIDLIVDAVNADQDKVRQNLIIASRQYQPFGRVFPDIATEEWQNEVLRYCKDQGIKLVILDNFSTLAPSIEDENSSAKIGKVNSMLLKAKQAEVTCILVHHANKTNGSYRGSSNIAVTLDLIVALSRR